MRSYLNRLATGLIAVILALLWGMRRRPAELQPGPAPFPSLDATDYLPSHDGGSIGDNDDR
jgi:hypothetical protein